MTFRSSALAQVMLWIFVQGIFGAFLHLTCVTHVFLEDGTIAEIDPSTGVPVPENEDGNPLDEGCPYMSELTAANTLISNSVVTVVIVAKIGTASIQEIVKEIAAVEAIYDLSPSNSPPSMV